MGRIQHRRFVVQKVQLFIADFISFSFLGMGWEGVILSGRIQPSLSSTGNTLIACSSSKNKTTILLYTLIPHVWHARVVGVLPPSS